MNLEAQSESPRSRARACLLGGAIGDALGAPIEFQSLTDIRRQFGARGVTDVVAGEWPAGSITDDTQMTLFTAEGLIEARRLTSPQGVVNGTAVVCGAYLRWLVTQGVTPACTLPDGPRGMLLSIPELHARRAPGMTCLDALRSMTSITSEPARNGSKGCGGIMRVAPAGLFDAKNAQRSREAGARPGAFEMGRDFAALTHGHPTGYLAAAAFAVIIGALARGIPLAEAIAIAQERLLGEAHYDETLLAVNHGGDSDSTGSIAGNLLGLIHGEAALPAKWLDRLQLRELIVRVAEDLIACPEGPPDGSSMR